MATFLILTGDKPAATQDDWGDLFDSALTEALRTLSVPGRNVRLLVPWSDDLAPLVNAALSDSASSFDPEIREPRDARSVEILPYRTDGDGLSDHSEVFWRTSQFRSMADGPTDLKSLVERVPPQLVIALGLPKDASLLRDLSSRFERSETAVMSFGPLLSADSTKDTVGFFHAPIHDLWADYLREGAAHEEDRGQQSDLELSWEERLEPFIPFGLILQHQLQRWLSGDNFENERKPRR